MYLKLCDHLCANMHALYDGNEEKFKLVASKAGQRIRNEYRSIRQTYAFIYP